MSDKMRVRVGTSIAQPAVPLAANAHLYGGHITVRDVTGYARQRTTLTLAATDKVIGVSDYEVDATNFANRVKKIPCSIQPVWLPNSSLAPVLIAGQLAYLEDSEHVCAFRPADLNIPAGMILDIDTAKGVLVFVGYSSLSGVIELLASTGTGFGASRIGIEDAANNFAATNVETALAEIIADYAAITNGNGASKIGVEDAGNLLGAAANVETALAALAAGLNIRYGAADTNGAPTQAELVAGLGAGVNGAWGVFLDNHVGALQPYVCGFSTAAGGWWYLAFTAVGA